MMADDATFPSDCAGESQAGNPNGQCVYGVSGCGHFSKSVPLVVDHWTVLGRIKYLCTCNKVLFTERLLYLST